MENRRNSFSSLIFNNIFSHNTEREKNRLQWSLCVHCQKKRSEMSIGGGIGDGREEKHLRRVPKNFDNMKKVLFSGPWRRFVFLCLLTIYPPHRRHQDEDTKTPSKESAHTHNEIKKKKFLLIVARRRHRKEQLYYWDHHHALWTTNRQLYLSAIEVSVCCRSVVFFFLHFSPSSLCPLSRLHS